MRNFFAVFSVFFLTACVSTSPSSDETPSNISKMSATETHLIQANDRSDFGLAQTLPEKHAQNLTWSFAPTLAVSIDGGDTSVDIEPSQDQQIHLVANEGMNPGLSNTLVQDALSLKFHADHNGKILLYLPKQTRYLATMNIHSLTGQKQNLLYFSAATIHDLHLNLSNSMLEKLMLFDVRQGDLEGIATPYLLAWIKDSGKIDVHGMMGMRELYVWGSGPVNIYWLNSPILTGRIHGMSNVLLGGVAQMTNLDVSKSSLLDAKSLRTTRVFVKTYDNSKAAVSALNSLNAKADEQSNIYYYAEPKTLSRYYGDSGSILYAGTPPPACTLPDCPVPQRVLPG